MRVRPDALFLLAALTCQSFAAHARADSYDEEEARRPDERTNEPSTEPPEQEQPDGLSAGGLEVPGSLQEGDDQGDQVARELEEADRRDSGRGLEFAWLVGDIGLGVLDVAGFDRGTLLAPGDASSGVGVAYAGGLGLRLLYFTLGARVSAADVGTLRTLGVGGELGMKLPIGNLEPLAVLDVGYVGASGLAASATNDGLAGVGGLGLNLGLGADYYLSDYVSVGASLRLGLLVLGRPAQDPDDFVGEMNPVYADGGSGTGTSLALALRVGFHL